MLPQEKTLPELLESRAKIYGPRVFLLFKEEEMTMKLEAEANRVCHVLQNIGVKQGDKVALLLENCTLYVSAFFGIAKAGAVIVPINPRYSVEEMVRVIQHSDTSGLIFADNFWHQVEKIREAYSDLKWALSVGSSPTPGVPELRNLMRKASESPPPRVAGPDDLFAIIYTSGTTGAPKGVMLTHWNYVTNAYQAAQCKKMTPEDRFLTALPLCHVAPQVGAILAHLCAGGSVALMESFSPEKFLVAIPKYKATAFGGVPTIYSIFLALPNRDQYDFSSSLLLQHLGSSHASEIRTAFRRNSRRAS
jgi:acyl-CoA synthetase (AMP-forming)/AMP-acid ligase II